MIVKKRVVARQAITQPKGYRIIPLTQNQTALVSVKDFKALSQWNWFAHWNKNTRSFYAVRTNNRVKPHVRVRMGNVILGCLTGEIADHRNHDTLDNRRRNLRKCEESQNRKIESLTSIQESIKASIHIETSGTRLYALTDTLFI